MKSLWVAITLVAALVLGHGSIEAADIRKERVSFAPGASSATVQGTIKGDQTVDYLLGARQGQSMNVSMASDNGANYFNILAPGEKDVAMFSGSTSGNQYEGVLPATGDYTVRVYLMRSAARREETAHYTLTAGITGSSLGQAPAGDAKVAGTPYHATGTVPCSVGSDPKSSAQCSFGVIRGASGNAEVRLAPAGFDLSLHPDKVDTVLIFRGKAVISADAKDRVTAEKQGYDWSIGVNDFKFYTIPEAVIVGG